MPFGVKIPIETGGANYQWVQRTRGSRRARWRFQRTHIGRAETCGDCRGQSGTRGTVRRRHGSRAARYAYSGRASRLPINQFLDPALAAVAGKNPASVTNGTTPVTATASYQTDVQTLLTAFFAANPGAQKAVLVANAGHASQIRSWNGGGGVGVEVLVSEAAAGNTIALNPSGILVADKGLR